MRVKLLLVGIIILLLGIIFWGVGAVAVSSAQSDIDYYESPAGELERLFSSEAQDDYEAALDARDGGLGLAVFGALMTIIGFIVTILGAVLKEEVPIQPQYQQPAQQPYYQQPQQQPYQQQAYQQQPYQQQPYQQSQPVPAQQQPMPPSQPQQSHKYCPNCARQIAFNSNACPYCGTIQPKL